MQVQKGSSQSYTNTRTPLYFILEDEHHILSEEQKAYRARTRKFSLETNRRRKAQEERRREEDIREQRLREEILQQRRHKVQDVTERFQRAHLPPSQRKRQASRRATPHLEEALNQIQGSSSSSALQSTFFRRPTSNRSYASSPNSSASSTGLQYQKQLSAAVPYAKLMQERSGVALKNSQLLFHNELQEKQRLLEERQINSLQDFQREVGQIGQSESLSSLDSLENEGPCHQPAVTHALNSSSENSEVLNCARPQSPQKHFNSHDDMCRPQNEAVAGSSPPTQDTEEPGEYDKTAQARGERITESQKAAPALSHQSTFAQRGIIGNIVHLPQQSKSDQQNCVSEKAPALSQQAATILGGIAGDVVHPADLGEAKKAPAGTPCKAWTSPDTTPPESSWPIQGDVYGHMRTQADRFINRPEATQVVLLSGLCSDRELSGYISEDPSAVPSAMSQMSPDQEGSVTKPMERMSHLHKIHLACNAKTNCNKDTDCGISTQIRPSEPYELASRSYHVKVSQGHEQEVPSRLTLPSTSSSGSKAGPSKSVKGILKKESKYATTCHAKLTFSPVSCAVSNHFLMSVKDSMEVVKQRERDMEVGKGVKKKLRWYDEMCFHEENDESKPLQDAICQQVQGPGKPSVPLECKTVSVGHLEGQVPASGLGKTAPAPHVVTLTTPATIVGHLLTKQAWGYGMGSERERGEEARPERGAPRRARPRGPRRVRSARAWLGPAPSRTRKGVAVRPQSASEASQVHKGTQGRIIMPHPPPKSTLPEGRPALDSSTVEEGRATNAAKSVFGDIHGRMGFPAEQSDLPEGYNLPPGNSVLTTTGGVAFTPFPPSYTLSNYETVSKATNAVGSGQQDTLGVASRRGPLYVEHGLKLAQTPTDEEISQLWHGVRSALSPKDATKNTVRRKQAVDGIGTKHRALLEQRRVNSGSGMRKPPAPSQTSVQISPLGSKADQIAGVALQDEVSESTAQFLLAETLADSSATGDDILAAMETAHTQLQQQTGPQQCPQSPGPNMSALSLEEQRLLQSLDRLNYRLHCVQEAAAGNATNPRVLQITAPTTSLSSRLVEGQAMAQRRYCTNSAASRSRLERRY
ncbi:centrosomal protein of 126 kDa isoform X2 [Conger conger]|uniref:centrosomal protein of 126 kDa isoform X2 n=1 Tax=Conger conger TaxID=82655 RepID=UPI002A5A84AE|nr:centrosomal protein of 126 kDa isoform X2 [Conger conger]